MLKNLIVNKIRNNGAMPIDEFMQIANSHYYATRDPFGILGDFITAPEISQIFGEMIAVWAIKAWQKIGSPKHCAVIEIGGGRGTLMADLLRAIKIAPDFKPEIHFVETSPVLSNMQLQKVPQAKLSATYPELTIPTIVIANEFFDALPIKQFVGTSERKVLEKDGELSFNIQAEDGSVTEVCTAAEEIMQKISSHAAAGIIIDYGYLEPTGNNSLQAVKNHKYSHPLHDVGESDLTALVNFQSLSQNCKKPFSITTQREFLLAHGGDVRAKILGKEEDFDRLISPQQMGNLFKVLCF